MPYIDKDDRDGLWPESRVDARNTGDLNFQFTVLAINYLVNRGISNQTLTDIRGALDGAKTELERRVTGPYEDRKINDNGDIYTRLYGYGHPL